MDAIEVRAGMWLKSTPGKFEKWRECGVDKLLQVPTERTELQWTYTPTDFFEVPYRRETDDYALVADGGIVRVTLRKPCDPIDAELQSRITKEVEGLFRLRQLQVQHPLQLKRGNVYHSRSDGTKSILTGCDNALSFRTRLDTVHQHASGEVAHDSRAERIEENTKFIESLIPKLAGSETLNALLESYNEAVSDPKNELVHLYEIRDALSTHHGGDAEARQKLQIAEGEWKRLGYLANKAPLKEGRHRGEHSELRHATPAELNEARKIARSLIEAFANQL